MPHSDYDLLFIDDDKSILQQLESIAKEDKWSFLSLASGKEAIEHLDRFVFKVVVTELNLPDFSSLQILEWLKMQPSVPEVIIITNTSSIESAVKALKLGAFDYLTKPFSILDRVRFCIHHAFDKYNLTHRLQAYKEVKRSEDEFREIIGKSPKLMAVFDMIRNIASSNSNVLIQGESGTGKELVARALHEKSRRHPCPLVVINCSAMPETLLESELFGYVKGAFTDATEDKIGLFEAANGGSVFLDEIGEVSLSMQIKLLRVLQEGEIRKIGDTQSRHVDVRLLAATNKNLDKLTQEGLFREDLYYRLNVISITLPPLRERGEDVLLLAYHFLEKVVAKTKKKVKKISIDALQALQDYTWPGNVRELENTIERAVVLCDGNTITAKNLSPRILSSSFYNMPVIEEDISQLTYKEAKKRTLNIFNRSYMMTLLEATKGNISVAAEKAGLDRSNFKKIVRKYNIQIKQK